MNRVLGKIPAFGWWLQYGKPPLKSAGIVRSNGEYTYLGSFNRWLKIETDETTRVVTIYIVGDTEDDASFVDSYLKTLVASYQRWLAKAWPAQAEAVVTFQVSTLYAPMFERV